MEKVGLICQPCGLGDILFIQKIAYHMKSNGYNVWWPIAHEFRWLKDYISSFNFTSWDDNGRPIVEESDAYNLKTLSLPDDFQFPYKEYYSLANRTKITDEMFFFQGFAPLYSEDDFTMLDKYRSINLNYDDWGDYVLFDRDTKKEDELFYNTLGLSDDEDYIIVSRYYNYRPIPKLYPHITINEKDQHLRVVEPRPSDNFTLFDWCKVFEHAKSIYMISTSFNFMLESPIMSDSIKDKGLYLYSRSNTFEDYDKMFKLPWKYIEV